MSEQKTYTIRPSWKHFFWSYVLSVITIPLAGAGLIGLYLVRKKHKSIRYKVSDDRITSIDQKYQHNVDLVDIQDVHIHQSWLQEQLGIATLELETSASHMNLLGISNPAELKKILLQAIQDEKKRQQQREETQRKQPEREPGNMEKMDYLTGLWQQGLISEEDYKAEKKHFE